MPKNDTSLDDIAQSIADLGTMIDARFNGVEGRLDGVEGGLRGIKGSVKGVIEEQRGQGVLLEDLTHKFDKNINLLSKEMRVKKRVDEHEARIGELESGQKTIKSVVKFHSKQLAAE